MIERVVKGSGELGSRTVQKALAAVPPRKEDRGLARVEVGQSREGLRVRGRVVVCGRVGVWLRHRTQESRQMHNPEYAEGIGRVQGVVRDRAGDRGQ